MFTVGPVHTQDHGTWSFVVGVRSWLQGLHEGHIVYLIPWRYHDV